MAARSWDKDEAFVAALEARKYVTRDSNKQLVLVMSDGVYLYLHELFQDGTAHALALVREAVLKTPPR